MIHTYYQYNPEKNMDKRFIGFTTAATIGMTVASGALSTAGIVAGTAITAGAIGLGAYGISQMTKQPKQAAPAALPASVQAATPTQDKAEATAKADLLEKRRSMARNKTIYTGPLGLTDEDKSGITKKTLLGE